MNYPELLAKAIALAATAHQNQINSKNGEPYILHPIRVMRRAKTDEERIVAILHDVLEDCDEWTKERLSTEGFPDEIVEAIVCLSRKDGETYPEFIDRVCTNRLAMKVKRYDLEDNLDPDRLSQLDEQTQKRLKGKYKPARSQILAKLVDSEIQQMLENSRKRSEEDS